MADNPGSSFVYVTYIRATPEKLWAALTSPEFNRQYWFGAQLESEWTKGAAWRMIFTDGRITDAGEVLEVDPPKRLVLKWLNQFRPELSEEGASRCVMELEPAGAAVKLTITHTIDRPESKLITAVSGGWPKILSNLKSLLETGTVALTEK